MRRPVRLAPLAAVAAAACLGAPGAPGPAGALRYGSETAGALVYSHADTAVLEIAAGGQAFEVDVASAATWGLTLRPAEGGVRVTATLRDLDARLDNPVAGVRRADETDVGGPVVFTLGPRGEAALESAPAVAGTARELFSAAPLVHHLFPRVAGRAVAAGVGWTDTIRYAMDQPGADVSAEVVLAYAVAGDTTVAGRPHLLVRFQGRDRRTASGEAAGMAFTQEVAGPVEGSFLWDPALGAPRALEQRSDLRGTMTVSLSPEPLAVRVRGRTRVELQDPAAGPPST